MDRTGSLISAVGDHGAAVLWRVGESAVRRFPAADVESTALLPDGSGLLLCRRVGGGEYTLEQWTLQGARTATLAREPYRMYPSAGPGGLVAVASEAGEAMVLDAQGLYLAAPRPDAGRVAVLGPRGSLWRLDSDVPRVIREVCAGAVTVDWDRYFPDSGPKSLCPDFLSHP